jgi:hypothetical protein
MKCSKCGHQKPKKTKFQTFRQQFTGKTVLGRAVESEIKVKFWLCECGGPTVEGITLPLDPDAGLLRAYEREFGTATPAVVEGLGELRRQACLQLGNEMEDRVDFFMDAVRRCRAELGDDWADRIDFTGTQFVVGKPPPED